MGKAFTVNCKGRIDPKDFGRMSPLGHSMHDWALRTCERLDPSLCGLSRSLCGNGLGAARVTASGPLSPPGLRPHHQSNFSLRTSEESKPLLHTFQIHFRGPQLPLLSNHAFWSLLQIYFFHHAMTPTSQRNLLLVLELFVVLTSCAKLNYSGEAFTTRYWDCCKPSCGWKGKASVNSPVGSCSADEKPINIDAGTGCNGGAAFACSQQQPWAVNETFSYGFAGVYLTQELVGHATEDAWCCACYQLDFTSEPLRGKSMIVQASNTAYDVNTVNRFTLAVCTRFVLEEYTLISLGAWRQHDFG